MDGTLCDNCGHARYGSRVDYFDDDDDDEICSNCGKYYASQEDNEEDGDEHFEIHDSDCAHCLVEEKDSEEVTGGEAAAAGEEEEEGNDVSENDVSDEDEDREFNVTHYENYNEEDFDEEDQSDVSYTSNDSDDSEDDFLERRCYGFFRCPSCRQLWESAYVFCRREHRTLRALYKQECKNCRVGCLPYKVEPLRCSLCGETDCACEKQRHSDVKKPHRSDLCHRCLSGRPCQHQ